MEQKLENLKPSLNKIKKSKKVFVVVAFAIIALGFFIWLILLNLKFNNQVKFEEKYAKARKSLSGFEKIMRDDVYGGKTPQETLDLFIAALKKDDLELASEYFLLETNLEDKNYLTKNKALAALLDFKKQNKIQYIIDLLSRAVPASTSSLYEGDYNFVAYDGKMLVSEINLEFNKYSQVWKIQSF
ncbi:MAG: hypothetical protein QMD50_00360 [Patescibacteria group bacterium]|nr:hypothetical protein [Patescibacteria group bacterium]